MKKIKAKVMLLLTTVMAFAMSVASFAADTGSGSTFDVAGAIGTGVESMQADVMAIIAVVVPAVMAITVAIIGIRKGISVFKSLTSK
jgi:hypothetical protein